MIYSSPFLPHHKLCLPVFSPVFLSHFFQIKYCHTGKIIPAVLLSIRRLYISPYIELRRP